MPLLFSRPQLWIIAARPPAFLIWHRDEARLDSDREPRAGFQRCHFVAKYVDRFAQEYVFGIFPGLFSRQVIGEIAFVSLQAIIPTRTAFRRNGLLPRGVPGCAGQRRCVDAQLHRHHRRADGPWRSVARPDHYDAICSPLRRHFQLLR